MISDMLSYCNVTGFGVFGIAMAEGELESIMHSNLQTNYLSVSRHSVSSYIWIISWKSKDSCTPDVILCSLSLFLSMRTDCISKASIWIQAMIIVSVTTVQLFLHSLQCKPYLICVSTLPHCVPVGDPPVGIPKLGNCYAVQSNKIIFIAFCMLIFQETGWFTFRHHNMA